ncbi:hypothetical protein Jab_1c15970 [Janthinobacterium sp. HH01]|uniref:hypothetical protein n=1 Tax=Janthinobacterium sp. HH01 TaxID=1198452 RepID=UPI0002AED303|nr:hypothetical protein [Janthinobacterium sp. HH01]ELX12979.1 hypothetical protein Jab_1c15970 [Janthinobacterium sp. HH01]
MNDFVKPIFIFTAACAAAWTLWPAHTELGSPLQSPFTSRPFAADERQVLNPATVPIPGHGSSPFARGTPQAPPHTETVAIIKAALKQMGLRTPDRYYDMGYQALKKLADDGDIYANIQLGTRYLFTRTALEYDQDFDLTVNPNIEAFKAFSNAAQMGSTAAMAVLSTKLAGTDPIDAYAWKLLANRLSSESQREFYQQNNFEFHLSQEELAKANARSAQLMQQLLDQPRAPLPAG